MGRKGSFGFDSYKKKECKLAVCCECFFHSMVGERRWGYRIRKYRTKCFEAHTLILRHTHICQSLRPWLRKGHGRLSSGLPALQQGVLVEISSTSLKRSAAGSKPVKVRIRRCWDTNKGLADILTAEEKKKAHLLQHDASLLQCEQHP